MMTVVAVLCFVLAAASIGCMMVLRGLWGFVIGAALATTYAAVGVAVVAR